MDSIASKYLILVLSMCILLLHALAMPIQYDEAAMILSIHQYGLFTAFTHYQDLATNNHPLLSLIIAILLKVGITSTFIFRLPSLVASFFILLGLQRITKYPIAALLAVSIPLLSDYFVLERGYALGLAFLLWGLLMRERVVLCGILWGLATICVPTYALDVAVIAIAVCILGERQHLKSVGVAALLSLAAYSLIIGQVFHMMFALSGESKTNASLEFVTSLSPFGLWAGFIILICAIGIALWKRGLWGYLLLFSVPFLFFGYARTHLLAAVALLIVLVSMLPRKWWINCAVIVYCFISLSFFPWDRIITQQAMWPSTGFAIARQLVPCIAVQKKSQFVLLHDYYFKIQKTGPDFDPTCPYFVMTEDEALNFPKDYRLFSQILSPYHTEMYWHDDLYRYIENLRGK